MSLLKRVIQDNWIGRQFIKIATNASLKTQIEHQTSFLDGYYPNIKLKQRAFVLLNDLTEEQLPYCRCGCGRRASLNREPDKGFSKYFNEDCHRRAPKISDNALEKLSNKDWLFEQRITLKKAIGTIGDELGVSHVSVDKWLKKHGIKQLKISRIRNLEGYSVIDDKEKLVNLYDSGLTCQQIAEPLNVTRGAIARTLKSYGVKLRPSNSYERTVKKVSGEEQELIDFIGEIYKDEILTSNRSVLNGRELDIYLPKHNLAIEYNGLYSHSYKPWEERESLIKGPNYHLSKTVDCEKLGIQLIHIFSDEWNYRQAIVKSILKSKLGINERIYARKCSIVEVDIDSKNKFLNDNHIQGEDKSSIKLGLEYERVLVCLMTFNKSRFNKKYEWELVRFCNTSGINVVGGFSRLLSYFRTNFGGSIISYADRRYSDGGVYFKNGFELIRVNKPGYYYVDKNYLIRHNRMKFQKKLIGAYDCTEYEKAREMGFNKIFDCGSLSFGVN
jgi:transposase-like protein